MKEPYSDQATKIFFFFRLFEIEIIKEWVKRTLKIIADPPNHKGTKQQVLNPTNPMRGKHLNLGSFILVLNIKPVQERDLGLTDTAMLA